MVEGKDGGGQSDPHPPGAGGDGRGQRGRVHREPVVDEVVLGEPDRVEAQLFRPLRLLELVVDDVAVVQLRRRLEEVVGPESHAGSFTPQDTAIGSRGSPKARRASRNIRSGPGSARARGRRPSVPSAGSAPRAGGRAPRAWGP